MINDLGRRYGVFVGTARGKQRFLAVITAAASVLDLTALTLTSNGHKGPAVVTLFSLAGGLLAAAVFLMLMNRRSA